MSKPVDTLAWAVANEEKIFCFEMRRLLFRPLSVTRRQTTRFSGKLGGDRAQASFGQGVVLMEADRLDEAHRLFSEAIAHDPADSRSYAGRASALERMGRLSEAEEDYRRVLELMPDSPPGHVALAECLRHQGRADEALRLLEHLMASVGEYGPAARVAGEIHLERSELEDAVTCFQNASARGAEDYYAWSGLAQTQIRLYRFAEAEEAARKALQLAPDSSVDAGTLATALYQQNRFEDAIEAFDEAVRLAGDIQNHIGRAAALLQAGEAQRALQDLQHAEAADETGMARHVLDLMMGLALEALSRPKDARPYFEHWLEQCQPGEEEQARQIKEKLETL